MSTLHIVHCLGVRCLAATVVVRWQERLCLVSVIGVTEFAIVLHRSISKFGDNTGEHCREPGWNP